MAKPSESVGKGKRSSRTLPQISPATDRQREAMEHLRTKQVVIMEGLAGTGKTFLAVHHAITRLFAGDIKKVIFTRPLTTVGGEKLGFLPGDVDNKTRPYTEQFLEYIEEFAPMLLFEEQKKVEEQFEFIPLAFLRGRNFRNVVIIADEMQNSSPIQMKTLMTRITDSAQLIMLGDTRQEDVRQHGGSGLTDLAYKLSLVPDQEFIGHTRFGVEDIQRGEFVKFVMQLYGDY